MHKRLVTFKHRQHHRDHILLQIQQLFQQINLARVLGQFVLHVREQEEETTDGVPQPGVGQSLLILGAGTLDDLGQGVENLASYAYGLEEIRFTGRIDQFLARVVPVEVHYGLL